MVTGVFYLLKYLICKALGLVIRNTQNFFYHLHSPIGKTHRFSFLKRVKLKIFCSQITAIFHFSKNGCNFNITI